MTYIFREGGRPPRYVTTPEINARFPLKQRPTGRIIGGLFREVEADGRDENVLEVNPAHMQSTAANGRSGSRVWARYRRSADAQHKCLRAMREDDEAAIAEIDARIEAQQAVLRDLRSERVVTVQKAWRRGRQVPLAEVVDLALETVKT